MTNEKRTGIFVIGTLIGGLIGAVAALLYAPRSGEKTQELILEKGEDLRQNAEQRWDDGRQYAEDKFGQVKEKMSDLFSGGRTLLDETRRGVTIEKQQTSS